MNIGAVFNSTEATMRKEGLLTQSQQLVELQARLSELQNTNEQLGTKAQLLAEQNAEVERKNAEVEQARSSGEHEPELFVPRRPSSAAGELLVQTS
jgi:prefoldin subunit 5